MTLPSFVSVRRRLDQSLENYRDVPSEKSNQVSDHSQDRQARPAWDGRVNLKRATRTRRHALIFSAFCFLVAVVFLILVEIGNIYRRPVLNDIYFLKLDVSNIIPQSVPDATLINSIARSLGLHDFYTVGLWNFCEGYNSDGVTDCSSPRVLYWFNPVSILLNELLSGATIALPYEVVSVLNIVETASHWMFGLFLTGVCLTAVSIPLTLLPIYTRWLSLPVAIFTFLAALTTTVATVLATAIFVIFQKVVQDDGVGINLEASIGARMFAFMWIASGAVIIGFLVNLGMCCCCASRRDVKTGRKKGKRDAYADPDSVSPPDEKHTKRRRLGAHRLGRRGVRS